MPDETKTVTVDDKTFQIKVPKGSSKEFIEQAAGDYYDKNYTKSNRGLSYRTTAPDVNLPDIPESKTEGFGEAFKSSAAPIVQNPVGALNTVMPGTEQINPQQFAQQMQNPLQDVPGYDAIRDLFAGNLSGAAGRAVIPALYMAAASPMIRGGIRGGMRSIPPTVQDIASRATPLERNLGRAAGVGIGYEGARWPGAIAGGALGGELGPTILHPIQLLEGILRGAERGSAGKSLIPQMMSNIPEPLPQAKSENIIYPNFDRQIEGHPPIVTEPSFNDPQTRIPGPTPQISKPPIITPAPQAPNVNVGSPEFWQRLQHLDPSKLKMPDIGVPETKPVPATENQQVPSVTASVKNPLPSGESLDLAEKPAESKPSKQVENPIETPGQKAAKRAKEAVEKNKENPGSTVNKGFKFTHKQMGDIAKSISTPEDKITMQEVGRFIHNNYGEGSYEEGKFNKDFGASRESKSGRKQVGENVTKSHEAMIKEGIRKYIKDNPHEF